MSGLSRIRTGPPRETWGVSGDAGAVLLALHPDGEPLGVIVHSAFPLAGKNCEPHPDCEYLPGGCWVLNAGPAYAMAMISVAAGEEGGLYAVIEGFYSSLADVSALGTEQP